MSRYWPLLFSMIISFTLFAAQEPASGADRVALVIGNGSYDNINDQLKNPPNDATAIAAKLRSLDIEVIEATNLDYRGMREALRTFDRALQDADAGLFFYAGHGMEYEGHNYLFPTDVILETEGDIGLSLIDVEQVLRVMETAVPTRLVFLDACRDNPLISRFGRAYAGGRTVTARKGLGRIDTAVGTFIAYATAPGAIAEDGKGENSPFTDALLLHLDEPGLEISQLMHKVRNSVIEATNEKQIPWESSSLRGPFVINQKTAIDPFAQATLTAPDTGNNRAEAMFWDSIKDDHQASSYKAYLQLFGEDGQFASLALARIKSIGSGQPEDIEAALDIDRPDVQKNLSALGFYDGDISGAFDWRTRLAIQKWQQDKGVAGTGYLAADQAGQIASEAGSLLAALDATRTEFIDEQQQGSSNPIDSGSTTSAKTSPAEQPSRFDDLLNNQSAEDIIKAFAKDTDVAALEAKAEDGDATASTVAGLAYILGRHVGQDYLKARTLFEQGCDEGIARSCHSLATMYENGLGVDRDYGRAGRLFDHSCERGISRSCKSLGYLYQKGFGVEQDYAKAHRLFERSCNDGYPGGCTHLGTLYDEGLGVRQDHARARDFYDEGCKAGDPHACTNLGYHYDQGLGVGRDYAEAKWFYEKGCDGGSGSACANLGYLYDGGLGVDPDYVSARNLYERGCDLGHPRACSNLGNLYDGGLGVDQDYAQARLFYEEGCRGGHASGCNNLGYLYQQGLGVNADASKAEDLFRQACALGDTRSCEMRLR